jgi:hypothetical protein
MRGRDEIVAAARGCIGARFRPHGRDPRYGLDCIGVAAIAFDRLVPADYPLRGGEAQRIAAAIDGVGLRRADLTPAGGGRLLLIAAGPGQFHVGITTKEGFVHADASLRRVVETPGRPTGVVIGAWEESD